MGMAQAVTDEDFSEEIRANIALDTNRLIAEGMSPEEARAAAHRAFGNVTRAQERFYESRRIIWLDDLQRDIRYAFRTFRRAPLAALTIVATVALGLGLVTAVFAVYSMILSSCRCRAEPRRAVCRGALTGPGDADEVVPFTRPEYEAMRRETSVFTDGSRCCAPSGHAWRAAR